MLVAMRVLSIIAVLVVAGCSRSEPATAPPPETSPVEETAPAELPAPTSPTIAVTRDDCEEVAARAVDVAPIIGVAVGSLREAAGDVPVACDRAVPRCASEDDGTTCAYVVRTYDAFHRVTVYPAAADGGLVEGTAFVALDGTATEPAPELDVRRWAVEGDVRCRGGSQQHSYGPATRGALTTGSAGVTCWTPEPFDVTAQRVTTHWARGVTTTEVTVEPARTLGGEPTSNPRQLPAGPAAPARVHPSRGRAPHRSPRPRARRPRDDPRALSDPALRRSAQPDAAAMLASLLRRRARDSGARYPHGRGGARRV